MHMSKVSIRDVAALAGVSTATVSHVINNTRYVKEETKRLVLKSIEELQADMQRAAETENYEEAAKIKEEIDRRKQKS